MATTFTIMTFEQWKKANPDVMDEEYECEYCEGEGVHTCECGDQHDCGYCNGSGTTSGETIKEKYNKQKKADEAKLEKWISR